MKPVDWHARLRRRNAGLVRFDARKEALAALLVNRRTRKLYLTSPAASHLRALAAFPNLRELTLEAPRTLAGLERAKNIEVLCLTHFLNVTRLDPVAGLKRLRKISLQTLTSWDGSGRHLAVRSLQPLATLKALRSFEIIGAVRIGDRRLDPLHGLTALREVQIPNASGLRMRDFVRLKIALPRARGTCLRPHWVHPPLIDTLRCRKCGTVREYLTAPGPRKRLILCPACDDTAFARHQAAWRAELKLARRG